MKKGGENKETEKRVENEKRASLEDIVRDDVLDNDTTLFESVVLEEEERISDEMATQFGQELKTLLKRSRFHLPDLAEEGKAINAISGGVWTESVKDPLVGKGSGAPELEGVLTNGIVDLVQEF